MSSQRVVHSAPTPSAQWTYVYSSALLRSCTYNLEPNLDTNLSGWPSHQYRLRCSSEVTAPCLVTEGLHASPSEKSETPSKVARRSHGLGVSQCKWWPRQPPLLTWPCLFATVSGVASDAEVCNNTNAASSEGTGGNVPAALWTGQQPAAASAAWAVRQQTGCTQEQSEAAQTDPS